MIHMDLYLACSPAASICKGLIVTNQAYIGIPPLDVQTVIGLNHNRDTGLILRLETVVDRLVLLI